MHENAFFFQSHFTLILANPKPIYGIQYNFTLPGTRSCESSYITTTTGSDRSGLRPCLDVLFPCCFSDPLIAVGYSPQYTNYSWWLQSIWTLCMQCDTIVTSDVFIQRSEWSCHLNSLNTKYIYIYISFAGAIYRVSGQGISTAQLPGPRLIVSTTEVQDSQQWHATCCLPLRGSRCCPYE